MSLAVHDFPFYSRAINSLSRCTLLTITFFLFPDTFCTGALLFLSPHLFLACNVFMFFHTTYFLLHAESSNYMQNTYPSTSSFCIFLLFPIFSFFFSFFYIHYVQLYFSVLQLLKVTGSNVPIQFQSTTINQSLHLFAC
jgi:hypothetical protein